MAENEITSCEICKKKITKKNVCDKCDGTCGKFFCKHCAKVDNEFYKKLVSGDGVWRCIGCENSFNESRALIYQDLTSSPESPITHNDTSDNSTILKKLNTIIDWQRKYNPKFDTINEILSDVKQLISENKKIKEENLILKKNIVNNEIEMQKLKQYHFRKDLIIDGLKMDDKESIEKNVEKFCKTINVNVNEHDISKVYIKPSKLFNAKKKVIIRFKNLDKKVNLLKNKKKLKENNHADPVYINEKLTPYYNYLYKLARDAKKDKKIKSTWVFKGKVTVCLNDGDDAITVHHVDELNNLTSTNVNQY